MDAASQIAPLASAVAGLALLSAAALRGWRGWLELRRLEMAQGGGPGPKTPASAEIARLRDRVRRLEAIAAGVEQ